MPNSLALTDKVRLHFAISSTPPPPSRPHSSIPPHKSKPRSRGFRQYVVEDFAESDYDAVHGHHRSEREASLEGELPACPFVHHSETTTKLTVLSLPVAEGSKLETRCSLR